MPKSNRYVLWGSAGHAKVLADLIDLIGGHIVALFDNNPEAISCLPSVPLFSGPLGLQEWLKGQKTLVDIGAVIAIGGAKGNDRQELAQLLKSNGLSLPTLIHPSASVSKSVRMEEGCQILANVVVAADVSMGKVCIVNNSANIDHECQFGNGVHIAPAAVLCGCVKVADNVMIGAGAVVMPRLFIGSNALIGAGAVVTKNVPSGAVVVGNPARIIRTLR